MAELNLNLVKQVVQGFDSPDREILSKFLDDKPLSGMEMSRAVSFSFPFLSFILLNMRFQMNQQQAEAEWAQNRPEKLENIGSVKNLTVLPLIDYYGDHKLATEPEVSYLIEADEKKILFDTGFNAKDEHPSPLLQNMAILGVHIEEINHIFISHIHRDHVGGTKRARERTFALSGECQDLSHIEALTPGPMTHPTARITHLKEPKVLSQGLVSLGPIRRSLFFFGLETEQALAVNVEGKGIIVIVGCGHQGLHKLIDRVEHLFDIPLYGLVGGLHYPISASRLVKGGLPIQRLMGTGKPVWDPPNQDDLQDGLEYLKARNPKLVALSPHDSCDESIKAFETTFGKAFRHIKVGEKITIA